ncbi:MAG: hypothetical protein ACREU2_07720, partial [Steroidobacteraceae bacterium]
MRGAVAAGPAAAMLLLALCAGPAPVHAADPVSGGAAAGGAVVNAMVSAAGSTIASAAGSMAFRH